jgi:choline dehydrogenase
VEEVFWVHAAKVYSYLWTNSVADFARLSRGTTSSTTQAELDAYPSEWPEYEHLFQRYFGYANDSSDAPTDGRNYVWSSAALTKPFSRGNVTITSADTSLRPVVSPNWLLEPQDQEVTVTVFKQARAVFTHNKATAAIVVQDEVFPGTDVETDSQILDLIQRSTAASYHGSCTCAMGLESDPMAVLDSKARVYGVKGLRVVDASAFPVLPPGHPSSTVCTFSYPSSKYRTLTAESLDALAERIAEVMLENNAK